MNSIRTEGVDLLDSTKEFSHDFAEDLGLRAFDPEDVERNVQAQIEKRFGLLPDDLFDAVKRDGKRLDPEIANNEEVINRVMRTAKRELLRLRANDAMRRTELLVKIRFLQTMITEKPVVVAPPPSMAPPKSVDLTRSSTDVASSSKRVRQLTADEAGATTTSGATPSRELEEPKTCYICNSFTTKSNRELNLHINQCLKKQSQASSNRQPSYATDPSSKQTKGKPAARRVKRLSSSSSSSLEDDSEVSSSDDYDEDLSSKGENQRRRVKTRSQRNEVDEMEELGDEEGIVDDSQEYEEQAPVEDDWDVSYCRKRLARHRQAYTEWIRVWQDRHESDARVAQEEAEKAYDEALERLNERARLAQDSESEEDDDQQQQDNEPRHELAPNELWMPQRLWNRLLPHQREAMPWLFKHHRNGHGAILGDEMGLGKTAQAIAFLAALKSSRLLVAPCLVLAPATTLSQWVQEFNTWAPELRIFVLHDSFRKKRRHGTVPSRTGPEMVMRAFEEHEADIIITTYQGLQIHSGSLLLQRWAYAVLDEAHCIRNPEINITKTCKQLRTCHRLALTGAPIQNRIVELWSLMDFVCPNRLGQLSTFERCFAEPIRIGGTVGARPEQVYQAFEQAKALRDEVTPFMLRRMKKDVVSTSLPPKTERVLFCNLTPPQRDAYLKFIKSDEVVEILASSRDEASRKATAGRTLRAISTLRKICNHPDLVDLSKTISRRNKRTLKDDEGEDEDDVDVWEGREVRLDPSRSSKMKMLDRVLQTWRKEGAKVLVFCQGTRMLSVLEQYARDDMGWPTMRMDGSTVVSKRQQLINRFNRGDISDTFLFLLTTRVGGIGVNLTGATKVVIFDPDWNPSTDAQARERAWRLGQTKPVTVFRMITSGTIEEKIYRRQIFKTFLTNKILHDPAQRRFFDETYLRDLFTLTDEKSPETVQMFADEPAVMEHDEGHSEAKRKAPISSLLNDSESTNKKKKKSSKKQDDVDDAENADSDLLKNLFASDKEFAESLDQDRVELASRSQAERLIAEKKARIAAKKARDLFNEMRKRDESFVRRLDRVVVPSGIAVPPSAAALLAGGSTWEARENETAAEGTDSIELIHARILDGFVTHLKGSARTGATTQELLKYAAPIKEMDHYEEVLRGLLRSVAVFNKETKRWFLKSNKGNPSSRPSSRNISDDVTAANNPSRPSSRNSSNASRSHSASRS